MQTVLLPHTPLFHGNLLAARLADEFWRDRLDRSIVERVAIGRYIAAVDYTINGNPVLGDNLFLVVGTTFKGNSEKQARILLETGPNFPDRVARDFGAVHAAAVLPRRQTLAANHLVARECWLSRGLGNNVELKVLVVVGGESHVDASLLVTLLKLHFESKRLVCAAVDFCENVTALPDEVYAGVKGEAMPIRGADVGHL